MGQDSHFKEDECGGGWVGAHNRRHSIVSQQTGTMCDRRVNRTLPATMWAKAHAELGGGKERPEAATLSAGEEVGGSWEGRCNRLAEANTQCWQCIHGKQMHRRNPGGGRHGLSSSFSVLAKTRLTLPSPNSSQDLGSEPAGRSSCSFSVSQRNVLKNM